MPLRINVVYAIPPGTPKYENWRDGFTAAMEIVSKVHEIRWCNVHPAAPSRGVALKGLFDADVLLVKSDWGWIPDRVIRGRQPGHVGVNVVLAISGSSPPPRLAQWCYDGLLYETEWYSQFVRRHHLSMQAFGVDTRVMKAAPEMERDIDWLMVGRPVVFKRPERLLQKSGRRFLVGEDVHRDNDLVSHLVAGGVQLVDFVSYEQLATLYQRTHNVLVPCEVQGGGERSVLEGRACGVNVEIAADNPKLESLLRGPVLSHEDYAEAILACLAELDDKTLLSSLMKRLAIVGGSLSLLWAFVAGRSVRAWVAVIPGVLRIARRWVCSLRDTSRGL